MLDTAGSTAATVGGADAVGARPSLTIQDGDTVILCINGEIRTIQKVTSQGKSRIGNNVCSLAPLIGAAFGSKFVVTDGALSPILRQAENTSDSWNQDVTIACNNRELMDAGSVNQQLTNDDIQRMKEEGKSGHDIIEALKEKSATFATKTKFSQEKYIKRKAKKYLLYVDVIRPTAASLCETYFIKDAWKIQYIRVDTLALLLSLGNIGAGARVLVMDDCNGLVTGAVIERMGGWGEVVAGHIGERAPSYAINGMINARGTSKMLLTARLSDLVALTTQEHAGMETGRADQNGFAGRADHNEGGDEGGGSLGKVGANVGSVAEASGPAAKRRAVEGANGQILASLVDSSHICPTLAFVNCGGPIPSEPDGPSHASEGQVSRSAGVASGHDLAAGQQAASRRSQQVAVETTIDGGTMMEVDLGNRTPSNAVQQDATGQSLQNGAPSNLVNAACSLDCLVEQTDKVQAGGASDPSGLSTSPDVGMTPVMNNVVPFIRTEGNWRTPRRKENLELAPCVEVPELTSDADAGKQAMAEERRMAALARETTLRRLAKVGFTSCILAAPYVDANALIRSVLPLLSPSASFAVYSLWLQPLTQAAQHLKASKEALNVQVVETLCREYQVLPARTHPHMATSGIGGYILSGTKVLTAKDC
eukprot:jgi/Botrbrau1/7100/Bobra.0165s0121.1